MNSWFEILRNQITHTIFNLPYPETFSTHTKNRLVTRRHVEDFRIETQHIAINEIPKIENQDKNYKRVNKNPLTMFINESEEQ